MKKKKIIKIILIVVVICVLIAGGIIFYLRKNKKDISVYSVSDLSMQDYWAMDNTSQGQVKEDKMQNVYLSDTQQVEKITVKEGDKVKKGQVILKYNSTLSNIELEKKDLEIKKLELNLNKAQKELEQIRTYQPNVPIYGSLPAENTAQSTEQNTTSNLLNLTDPEPKVEAGKEINPAPLTGNGTNEKPYLFLWEEGKEYEKSFIEAIINRVGENNKEVFALFMNRKSNSLTGEFLKATKIKFIKKDTDYTFSIIDVYSGSENDPLVNKTETTEEPKPEQPIPEVGPIYTQTEITRMIIEKEKEISEISLNIKVAKNEYKTLKSELDNTTVYSKFDGVVKTVLDPNDENLGSKPIIVISGGGGYFIQGDIGELDLDTIKIGQKVQVQSYETGTSAEGTIQKISDYPTNSYYRGGNLNVSYYPYVVQVGEDATFREGEYVSLKPVVEQKISNTFYIQPAFILSENGKYFAYVSNSDKKLEKREIIVGKNMQGMLEIKSGITQDDKIAFPYGKNVKEGTQTVDSTLEELYGY